MLRRVRDGDDDPRRRIERLLLVIEQHQVHDGAATAVAVTPIGGTGIAAFPDERRRCGLRIAGPALQDRHDHVRQRQRRHLLYATRAY